MIELGPILNEEILERARKAPLIPLFPAGMEGSHISLEPLKLSHAADLHAASNGSGPNGEPNQYDPDAVIWRYMFGGPYKSLDSFTRYIQGMISVSDGLAICILHRPSGRPIGVANYCANKPANLSIELGGIWYNPEFQGTGANREAMGMLLKHAFETLGYRRVEWKCNSHNTRSRRAALRLGFQFEGIFRQHMIIKGRNRDTAWFSMTRSDWDKLRAEKETSF